MPEKIVLKKFKNLISKINANKTALSFHLMPSRMAKIKKNDDKCWDRCGERESCSQLVGVQICAASVEASVKIPKK